MAKREIARFEQFLLLPQCFQKYFAADFSVKKHLHVERVKVFHYLVLYNSDTDLKTIWEKGKSSP